MDMPHPFNSTEKFWPKFSVQQRDLDQRIDTGNESYLCPSLISKSMTF